MKSTISYPWPLNVTVQLVLMLNQANNLKRKRQQLSRAVMVVGSTTTSSLRALDPWARVADALHRVPC